MGNKSDIICAMLVSNHPLRLLWGSRALWLWSALLLLCYQNFIHAGAQQRQRICFVFCVSGHVPVQYGLKSTSYCFANSFPPKVECGNSSFFSIIFAGHLKFLITLKKSPPEYPSPTCISKHVTM